MSYKNSRLSSESEDDDDPQPQNISDSNHLYLKSYGSSVGNNSELPSLKKRGHNPKPNNDSNSTPEIEANFSIKEGSSSRKRKYDHSSRVEESDPKSRMGPNVKRMMSKMGYQDGKGLGRQEQGIVEPIKEFHQTGRSGIGAKVSELEQADLTWDYSHDEANVLEHPNWLHEEDTNDVDLDLSVMMKWMKLGEKSNDMTHHKDFCDSEILMEILINKTLFDTMGDMELLDAVRRSNPFEKIEKGIFINRAAMKMANMDKVFDFMFTSPKDINDKPVIEEKDLLYFADVCAGPGGFSEYVLWKNGWQAKGIGFTLRESCDFKLENFKAATTETFEAYYGREKDGDIYKYQNINSLTEFVMLKTEKKGVHFMMADGGFEVKGNENAQEILSKRLYLCQFLVSLNIVRDGGHFVCKLFDLFTPFSAGLIYLMYRSFKQICIHKPNSSRPANSERYIICKFKRPDCGNIRKYMYEINLEFDSLKCNADFSEMDINEIVPYEILNGDLKFFNYLFNSNNCIGQRQITHLRKVVTFFRDKKLSDPRQIKFKLECLQYWGIPKDNIKTTTFEPPDSVAMNMISKPLDQICHKNVQEITSENFENIFSSYLDRICVPVGNPNECYFYLGCNKRVFVLKNLNKGFEPISNDIRLELSHGTLVFGEIIDQVFINDRRRVKFFHLIDAFSLGKVIINKRSQSTRFNFCELYSKALHKNYELQIHEPNMNIQHLLTIRTGIFYELKMIKTLLNSLVPRRDGGVVIQIPDIFPLGCQNTDFDRDGRRDFNFQVKGIFIIKNTAKPWEVHPCKSRTKYYFFKPPNGTEEQISSFDRPNGINACTLECYYERKIWNWEEGVGIKGEKPKPGVLHKDQLINFLDYKHGKRSSYIL